MKSNEASTTTAPTAPTEKLVVPASVAPEAPAAPAAPAVDVSENAHPNLLAVSASAAEKKVCDADAIASAREEAAAASAFDDGVDTTLEAMATLLNKLQVPTLQQALTDLGINSALPSSGRKEELTERLTAALQTM